MLVIRFSRCKELSGLVIAEGLQLGCHLLRMPPLWDYFTMVWGSNK